MEPGSSSQELAACAVRGMWGGPDEIREGREAISALAARCDQLEAENNRFRAQYGEAVADPLTELRLRLMRG